MSSKRGDPFVFLADTGQHGWLVWGMPMSVEKLDPLVWGNVEDFVVPVSLANRVLAAQRELNNAEQAVYDYEAPA